MKKHVKKVSKLITKVQKKKQSLEKSKGVVSFSIYWTEEMTDKGQYNPMLM